MLEPACEFDLVMKLHPAVPSCHDSAGELLVVVKLFGDLLGQDGRVQAETGCFKSVSLMFWVFEFTTVMVTAMVCW